MATTPYVLPRFGGLNLRDDPEEIGSAGAVDLLNADFDRLGRVRCRDGVTKVNSVSSTIRYFVPLTTPSPITIVTVGAGVVDKYSLAGVRTAVGTWTASVVSPPAKLGTPTTAEMVYIATENSGAGQTVRKYDGTTLTTGTGKPRWVGVYPGSNRLVEAGFFAAADSPTGANGSQSTVFMSDPGAPDTFSANNWLSLNPGDGEDFQGVASFGGAWFVFKRSRAFRFYGEDTDTDGQPIFRYTTIELPDSIPLASSPTFYQRVAAGPDGVYYMGSNGLWRTQGGSSVRVVTPIDPIFDGTANAAWAALDPSSWQLQWAGDRLYITYTTALAQRVLVWDTQTNVWTAFEYTATGVVALPTLIPGLVGSAFWYSDGADIYKSVVNQGTDAGANISWFWSSGADDLGEPGRVKVSLETRTWGYGTVTVKVANDFAAFDTGSALTLGASPTVGDAWQQVDREGTLWQTQFSGSGAGLVSRAAHYLSFTKPPGVQ